MLEAPPSPPIEKNSSSPSSLSGSPLISELKVVYVDPEEKKISIQ
jgi:hypothetical protein